MRSYAPGFDDTRLREAYGIMLECSAWKRSKGRRVSSPMAGVAFLLLGKKDASTTNFYAETADYAVLANLKSGPG